MRCAIIDPAKQVPVRSCGGSFKLKRTLRIDMSMAKRRSARELVVIWADRPDEDFNDFVARHERQREMFNVSPLATTGCCEAASSSRKMAPVP
jgi:hypothetical protein